MERHVQPEPADIGSQRTDALGPVIRAPARGNVPTEEFALACCSRWPTMRSPGHETPHWANLRPTKSDPWRGTCWAAHDRRWHPSGVCGRAWMLMGRGEERVSTRLRGSSRLVYTGAGNTGVWHGRWSLHASWWWASRPRWALGLTHSRPDRVGHWHGGRSLRDYRRGHPGAGQRRPPRVAVVRGSR